MRKPGDITVPLYRLAHGRSGDKGNRLNVSVIAYDAADWPLLVQQVTEARVLEWFAYKGATAVRRHLLPHLCAMNIVIENVLEGGVNAALCVDTHGKTLSFRLLDLPIRLDPDRASALGPGRANSTIVEETKT
ncbi:hypothetical protein P1J78_20130 [Psychromarinibacter sp. C21-152]|uniref:AtuA-like ferredoxin-fold domain-containing protein n=1 Tax=Psychromarinibacter sediminicola TaxID=3033385 RepID=A0AAE3NY24_9RHOB|nr:hypothetical protein [Psychromarinibacter sediminicola]MDF0603060.1 hypothetical protein [Psychromarinibacter sediminicola]